MCQITIPARVHRLHFVKMFSHRGNRMLNCGTFDTTCDMPPHAEGEMKVTFRLRNEKWKGVAPLI